MIENYSSVSGQSTSVNDLIERYQKATPDKENCLAHFEICRILKKVFPKIREARIRFQGGRKKVYLNLAPRSSANCSASDALPLTWHSLQAYDPKFDFHWGKKAVDYVEFISVSSGDRLNGNLVVREVRINNALKVEIFIAGRKVALNDIPTQLKTQTDLDNILYLVALSDLCRGFPVASDRNSRNKNGEVTGVCEKWTTGGDETSLRHRSVKCEGLLRISSKSTMCANCKHVRFSWGKYLTDASRANGENANKKRKREDLMDREELLQKLQEEKRLKRNAQRREAYLREKINVEMLDFDEEDNADFKVMFEKIPREKLNEDQLIFWEEQEKALKAKGATGNRWHPK